MDDALGRGFYVRPCVTDYGDLVAITGSMHMLYGSAADPTRDMSFSGANGGSPGGTTGAGASSPATAAGAPTSATQTPAGVQQVTTAGTGSGQVPAGTAQSIGGGGTTPASGAGGGAGIGPGGESLPFTGYPAAAVAAMGAALVAVGAALRRTVRPKRAER
ncbi:MAG: hypothetical protein QOH11_1530 [Solirubrobacteraceae bacterium]|nr:hypothetical protein [Solirubrobacteraceae bacterium]